MIMKTNIIITGIVVVIASLCSVSCGDWELLEEKPYSLAQETFLKGPEEVQGMIDGCYSQLRRSVCFNRYIPILAESLSDYCYGRGNWESSYQTGVSSSAVAYARDTWAVLYRSVRYINTVMAQVDDVDLTPKEYSELTGEARFIRAFSYSYLVKLYGGVPFFDENDTPWEQKPRASAEDLWKYIAAEAEYAAENLPNKAKQAGRPDKTAGYALLTEANLYLKDYQAAANAAKTAIELGDHSLLEMSVADDYEKLYGANVVTTPEEVFYFKFCRQNTNSMDYYFLCNPNPIASTNGTVAIYTDYKNNKVIAGWDKNDLRYQYSLYEPKTNKVLNAKTKTGMICIKYRDREATGSTAASDVPAIRFADILLYYAEAQAKAKGAPDASCFEAVNQIHRRAYGHPTKQEWEGDYKMADYPTVESFMEMLLKEKVYEQCFEVGKRYFDLKRLDLLAEYAVRAGRVKDVSEVKDAAYWWPIPTNEFLYNSALDENKDQNPGY